MAKTVQDIVRGKRQWKWQKANDVNKQRERLKEKKKVKKDTTMIKYEQALVIEDLS